MSAVGTGAHVPADPGADAVLVAVTGAVVVDVEGADRRAYLEDVTSQHLSDAEPGTTTALLVLDPQGAPLAVADAIVEPERVRLIAPDDTVAEHLVGVLGGRTFLADARFLAAPARVVALRGAPDAIAALLARATDAARPGELASAPRSVLPDGLDLIVEAEAAPVLVDDLVALGAVRAEEADLEDARVRAGRPAWGREIAPPHLPEELGLLPTHVHLAKGCYPGQEAVARMWMLGRPRRRLVRLRALDGVRLRAGHAFGEGRERVDVTSATRDGRAALALVGADVEVGARVALGPVDAAAEVDAIVGAGLPVPGHDPRMRRRRDAADPSAGAAPRVDPAARGPRRP
ncbi:MAG: hypothetical protein RLZZ272_519 [Actinomycetota bacterium]